MWFSLFATVLILAITFYEGLQGLFTAFINTILAILSASLAFGVYEDVYFAFLKDYQPDHGRAIALLGVFIVSLLVLRLLFEALIKGNLQFPVYVDRAGGGICGFFTGMIVVGMLCIGFEMLPFGDTVLSFARLSLVDKTTNQPIPEPDPENKNAPPPVVDHAQLTYVRKSPWLKQDEFTVALVSYLSGNALAGRNRFGDSYPDFMGQVYRSRARMGEGMQPTVKANMTVEGYWALKPTGEFFTRESSNTDNKKLTTLKAVTAQPKAGCKRLAVRVAFQDAGKLEFTPEQIRLVARDKTGRTEEYLMTGINEEKAAGKLIQTWAGEVFIRQPSVNKNTMDLVLVFEVPNDIAFDEGSFVELKQNARAEITPGKDQGKKKPGTLAGQGKAQGGGPSAAALPEPTESTSPGPKTGSDNRRPSGVSNAVTENHVRVVGIGPARDALVSNDLPFPLPLTEYAGNPETAADGALKGGRVTAPLTDDWQPVKGTQTPITRIFVPSDVRLIQVSVEKLQPGSFLGKAMGFAWDNVGNFTLLDSKGQQHLPVGIYGMALVGGKPTFEIVLLDEIGRQDDAVFGRVRLEKIKRQDFVDDYALYFVYQVKVGTKAVKIATGRSGSDIPLESYNLVAE